MTAPASGPRGIDHLVLAVADLDAAAARYEAMGFTVGRRNRHPWGTENRIIQLSGCFIELIAAGEGRSSPPTSGHFDFGFFVRRFLARHGEGFAMLALESRDAEADRATFDAAGIGGFEPFAFERRARAADGCETRVAFSLAFAASPAIPEAGFFTCRHETPDAFWNEALQRHANSADRIKGVVLLAAMPAELGGFLEAFTGAPLVCAGARNVAITTPRGSVEAMTPECFRDMTGLEAAMALDEGPRFAAFKVAAPRTKIVPLLERAGIPFVAGRRHVAVAAADNLGAALLFEG